MKYWIGPLFIGLTACVAADHSRPTESLAPGTEPTAATAEPDSAPVTEEEPDAFVYEEKNVKFCKDDIYASYLKNAYLERMRETSKGSGKARKAAALKKEQESAQFYASRMMAGESVQYFGGIPVSITPRVEGWIRYYKTDGREQFMKWLVRSRPYRTTVMPLIQKEGLPQELFFLAMIESGFNNSAYSRARATGTWQFMKKTAQSYGLTINHWVDERRDPVKSTIAAARYLKDLYSQFQNWHLAIAAYNAGPGKIRGAIRRMKTNDYWAIAQSPYITRETKEYVPKMLAALIISSNPGEHGFDVVKDMQVDAMTTVSVGKAARLEEIAQKLDVSVANLKRWNPELIRGIIPPPSRVRANKPYALNVPEGLADKFKEIEPTLAALEIKDVLMHTVRDGDTLSRLSKMYQVEIRQILSVNPTLNPARLKVGREIAIPVPAVTVSVKT